MSIPQRMSFFWAGAKLSWMRYLTLHSFRHYHPGWPIFLYTLANTRDVPGWRSNETQDSQNYNGPDYSSLIGGLDVTVIDWNPPFPDLSPAHACDLCQWEVLSTHGGYFADMDMLFVDQIPTNTIHGSDIVLCLSGGFMTVGFFASAPHNALLEAISTRAVRCYSPTSYQSTGAVCIYNLAGLSRAWGRVPSPGAVALDNLQAAYPDCKLLNLPSGCVYPWSYRELAQIYMHEHAVPSGCFGVHWFGGGAMSQEWNSRITRENCVGFANTFARYARAVMT